MVLGNEFIWGMIGRYPAVDGSRCRSHDPILRKRKRFAAHQLLQMPNAKPNDAVALDIKLAQRISACLYAPINPIRSL